MRVLLLVLLLWLLGHFCSPLGFLGEKPGRTCTYAVPRAGLILGVGQSISSLSLIFECSVVFSVASERPGAKGDWETLA